MVNTLSFRVRTPTPAGLTFPNCTAGLQWSYNSLGQTPCEVTAYLVGVCTGDVFLIPPIGSVPFYFGPDTQLESDAGCLCTTLVYSLFSACGACQGSAWMKWSQWSYNCSEGLSNEYPYPIPDGTRVPHWAYLDVITADTWNITAAENAGDSPEDSPSSFSQIQTLSVTASVASSQSSLSTHGNNLHARQIVPIVVGVLGTAMLITVIFWCFWRRRWRSEVQLSPWVVDNVAHMAEAAYLPDPGPPMPTQYYDPSDPSTFPPPIVLSSIPVAQTTPNGENGNGTEPTGANGRTEYSGLPLV
ncbi:hypothetical protein BC827DRAFT_1385884 [Russula dissimulans]|nr:hypothetical protein BC827DRAFT_1385884 [Russula dissimulans]